MTLYDAVVGLGANLGERRATLQAAAGEIAALGRLTGLSALYQTEPLGPPQPEYLNAAARLETELPPEALLDALLAIELAHGRVRRERWGPRVLDLDILWVNGIAVSSERLRVPHPELRSRAFALLPLLDVAPNAASPEGVSYREVSMTLDRSGISEMAGTRAGWLDPWFER